MEKILNQQLLSIEELIKGDKFAEALHQLRQMECSQLAAEEAALHGLLLAETKLWLGDYDVADILNRAVRFYRNRTDNDLFARAKYLYGWYLSSIGRHFDAREVLLESYLNYKRCDNLKDAALVLNRLAYVLMQTGAIADAIENLRSAIQICYDLGKHDNAITFSRNLAVAYLKSGAIQDANRLLKEIAGKSAELGESDAYQFMLIRGIVAAWLGDVKSALVILSGIELLSSELKREKALYYEYLGWVYLLDGKFKEAEKTLLKGIELSMKIAPESALISQTKRLLADVYIGAGRFDQAEVTARQALAVAEKINERSEIGACYRVFARVEQNRGATIAARGWYEKALDIFKMIDSRYELAVTRYLAASAGLYENGERAAMLYLAREYFKAEDIRPFVRMADFELARLHQPNIHVAPASNDHPTFIAADMRMKRIVELAENIAPSDMTVFLTGSTGTGKDLLARYIHFYSGRSGKFVTVNSAAIPDTMVEAELFGFKKGAFTGAERERVGLLEEADGGTFYLNEIADATPEFQAKLLEAIETKSIRPLGGNIPRTVDVRIIAATNHDLTQSMQEGRFRSDLYHRLNEMPIYLPALSERANDIPELVRHFLVQSGHKCDGGDQSDQFNMLCQILAKRSWPGNVRELKAETNRLYLLSGGDTAVMLELARTGSLSEKESLIKALQESDWNRREVARLLGISEGAVRYRIKKYGISENADA